MPDFGYADIYDALEELVKLQAHYANLLNMYDGGNRYQFKDAEEYLNRYKEIKNTPKESTE